MIQIWAQLIGILLGRNPFAVAVCAPASCAAKGRLGMRPQPTSEVVALIPCLGWIVVERVPDSQRGPPVAVWGGVPLSGEYFAGKSAKPERPMRKSARPFVTRLFATRQADTERAGRFRHS